MTTQQTIMTVTLPVEPIFVEPDGSAVEYRAAYQIDGYSDVLVTIRVGSNWATIHTKPLPAGPYGWWREPNAATRRRLLDERLSSLGKRRVGRCWEPSADEWFHRYDLVSTPKPADTRHP